MSLKIFTVAGALLLSGLTSALAQSAVYSDTKGKTCKQLKDEHELSEFECAGPAGQSVVFADMGGLFGVQFGKDALLQPPFPAADRSIGDKIEWRLDANGQPYASILRTFLGEQPPPRKPQVHQALVVTKIDGDSACHVAYVNAKIANANAKAAGIADAKAKAFRCGTDQPERIGNPAKSYSEE
jgi:hypothetical protein